MKRRQKRWLTLIAMALIFGIFASVAFQASNIVFEKYIITKAEKTEEENDVSEASEELQPEDELQLSENLVSMTNIEEAVKIPSVASVAEETMPSIVAITSVSVQEIWDFFGFGVREYPTTGSGSGIVVGENEEEILIATNNHVVEGAQSLSVFFFGSDIGSAQEEAMSQMMSDDIEIDNAVPAQIKGTDEVNDLAVVAVKKDAIPEETMNLIRFAKIGDSDSLVVGEQVVAIGNSLGYGQSVTSGWISALNRSMYISNGEYTELIQTDAAINPGNSGGALLNMQGELIGINSAKYASSGVEGMGYAIPISKAEPILEDLMKRKTRVIVDEEKAAYLGVTTADLTTAARQMYNMPNGVFVYEVHEDGPAEQAGLQRGDIIVSMDGMRIAGKDELSEKMRYFEAGEEIEVVIQRADDGGYVEHTFTVTLGSKMDVE